MMYYCYMTTPIGDLLLAGDEDGLSMIGFPKGKMRRDPEPDWIFNEKPFAQARRQLDEYFAGDRRRFELELKAGKVKPGLQLILLFLGGVQRPLPGLLRLNARPYKPQAWL